MVLMSELGMKHFDEQHEKVRMEARDNIKKLQCANKKSFNLKRKQETCCSSNLNDLVAIKRKLNGVGLKLKGKILGPYKIVSIKYYGLWLYKIPLKLYRRRQVIVLN